MKVYVVYYIPDYIGIDILGIYANEVDAKKCIDDHNSTVPYYDRWDYQEYDVL